MLPRPCAVILALFLGAGPALGQDESGESAWFPTREGTTWTYRLAEKKITVKVTKHEKQAGVMCARLETHDRGDLIAVQHVAVTAGKVLRVAHNGEKVAPPLEFLQLPPGTGQSWRVDSKITSRGATDGIQGDFTTAADDIRVLAGEYKKAIRVTAELSINGRKATITNWYAEKVGLVKQHVVMPDQTYDMELEKVELPR
jgi:hypothetical protein